MSTSSTVAIVLHWTRPDLTRLCVLSLAESEPPPDILIVDNGSTSAEIADLAASTPGVSRLALPRNLGFAGGMNAGIRWALARGVEFLWLVNDDAVAARDAHRHLVREASEGIPSIWSPVLIDDHGAPGHVGGAISLDGSALSYGDAASFAALADGPCWLTGTALFLPASVARRLGPLDERLFAYWEDVDWCLRAYHARIGVRISQAAVITHRQDAVTARSTTRYFLNARNEFLFVSRHVAPSAWPRAVPRVAARQIRLAGWLHGRQAEPLARAVLKGALAGLRGRTGPPQHAWLAESLIEAILSRPLTWAHRLEHGNAEEATRLLRAFRRGDSMASA